MYAERRAFVIGMIRQLRRFGPVARRGRMPRQQQPDTIRLEYYKAIMPVVERMTGAFNDVKYRVLALLAAERRYAGIMDSPSKDDAKRLIDEARRRSLGDVDERRLEDTAKRFAKRTSDFQAEQLDKQVRPSLGVPLRMVEPSVTVKLESFAKDNVELIKSVSDRFFDRIKGDVEDAFERGTRPEDLADLFIERDGMAKNDAMRIAVDQIGKLNGNFNKERQEQLGVTRYIWRTSNDQRVRDEHRTREGRRYSWSSPPDGGHPGEAIRCRCYAEPDMSEILDDL